MVSSGQLAFQQHPQRVNHQTYPRRQVGLAGEVGLVEAQQVLGVGRQLQKGVKKKIRYILVIKYLILFCN
jgi:hypothetical protein